MSLKGIFSMKPNAILLEEILGTNFYYKKSKGYAKPWP
jgi:hypothetical protein